MKQIQQPCLHSFWGTEEWEDGGETVNNMILAVAVRRELHTVHDAGHWIYYATRKGGEGREQVDESRERRHRDAATVTDAEEEKIAERHMHHNLEKRGRRTLC